MNTLRAKAVATIRIDAGLLDTLKREAKADNRSLGNYLETLLYRFGYRKDNEETLTALRDAKEGCTAGSVDVGSFEGFMSSVMSEDEKD